MNKIGVLFLFLLICSGCSNGNEMNQLISQYEGKIEEQQEIIKEQQNEIQELKEEIEQLNSEADYGSSLQIADRESRRIMRFISEGKFDELKKEYNVEFEVKDGAIHFGEPEYNIPFKIELAGYPMFIASFSNFSEGTDINYFIDEPGGDERHLINMSFDKDMKFEYIFEGEP